MLLYQTIPVTPFQQNCSLLWCDQTLEAAVVDPGGDLELIRGEVQRRGVWLTQILLTHAHIAHAGGTGTLARELGLPIVGPHPGDHFWIDGLAQHARMFGFKPVEPVSYSRWLADGDTLTVGNSTLAVRHCAGRTPGHVVFNSAEAQRAFVSDVLFSSSIGRTHFPGGDRDTVIASITQRLWSMGAATVFIPAHRVQDSLGRERRSNPCVAGTRGAPTRASMPQPLAGHA